MKLFKSLAALALPLAMLIPGASNAAMIFPALEVDVLGGDSGLSFDATSLSIDGTVTGIIDQANVFTAFATPQSFTLTATGTHTLFTPSGAPEMINGSYDGEFIVGGGLLSGSFIGLKLGGLSSQPTLTGDLIISGGSLMSSGTGRLELATAGSNVVGKLGAVVPVPAAIWLFGTGLIGLVGVARRKA